MLLMRRLSAVTVVAILFGVLPTTSAAGQVTDEYEEVVFRVTLEGPIDPSHSFSIRHNCREQLCVTQDIVELCAPPSEYTNVPTCSATTYELTAEVRAGLTLDYALLQKHPTRDIPQEHLNGSIVVQEGRQVISLGYVWPGGTPSQPSPGPVLPDTALPKVPADR